MAKVLSQEGKNAIIQNANLFADVCNALEVLPTTLPSMLQRNSRRLTELPALGLIADFLKVGIESLLEEHNDVIAA